MRVPQASVMPSLLDSFLRSTTESERERVLSELILVHAAPVVRRTLRRSLGFYVDHTGANPDNPEAEDLYHDTILKLIGRLSELKVDPSRPAINNFRQYVTRVATNVCHDYLRMKSPARARLKNSLRDLLDRHPDFDSWKNSTGEVLCGFASWRGNLAFITSTEIVRRLEETAALFGPGEYSGENVHQYPPLVRLVAKVLERAGGPVEVESLVETIARLQGIKDHTVESLDDDSLNWNQRLMESTVQCDTRIEAREMLQRLWDEIRQLPDKQRDTICLSFADGCGEDLFSLLLDAGVVTLPQIADELGMALDRLMALWRDMPMDNSSIAALLGATRAQVNKWRFRALRRLEKKMIACRTT